MIFERDGGSSAFDVDVKSDDEWKDPEKDSEDEQSHDGSE